MNKSKLIVGVGSALVDILVYESDAFVAETGGAKGGMTLVENQIVIEALARTDAEPSIVPGGSACNTIVGVGRLGGQARFVGKRGDDCYGQMLENDLQASGVEPMLTRSESSTGNVLSIITPDAQRTMFTYLGASAEAVPEELTTDCFDRAAVVHIEGYLLFNPDLITAAAEKTKQAGALLSLDLASFTVVEHSKEFLKRFVSKHVDILLANEDEAKAFTGYDDENSALKALAENVKYAVLKVGKRGSYVAHDGAVVEIKPQIGDDVIDTTGAGDLWASGFLYGIVNGFDMEKCGRVASACGYEVCRVVGANIPEAGWQRIKKLL